jgi:metal-responsive CopG/Arc/MetJ family transcriptional regulator
MTTQINIRLNEQLLQEIDTLAHMLHVPRSEWLRMKLAVAVKEDLLKYREALAMEYTMGHISFEELQTAVGREAEDVRMINDMTQKGKKEIDRLFGEG